MSSERDPLLATPSQHHVNVQNLEEAGETKELGPLEVSRSNRWAILGGIWIANFLCVRCTISCLIHLFEGSGVLVFKQCVCGLISQPFLNHFAAFSYHGSNPYVVRQLSACLH